mmetsp:Transcript_12818/g.39892  ORF Transcript_12818/g.39892 Transcript_12818/m.39892 type:complete len:242 (-) Transcript_12818:84-809(-)
MPSVTISVFCADTVACHMQQLGALRVRWVPPGVASSSPDCPPDCSIRNSQACSKAQPSLLSPSPDDRSHRSQRGDYHTARRLAPTRLPSEHCRRRHSSSMHGLTALARHVHRGRAIALGRRTSIRATPSRHAFDPAVQKGRAPPAAVRRGDAAVLGMYKRAQPRCIVQASSAPVHLSKLRRAAARRRRNWIPPTPRGAKFEPQRSSAAASCWLPPRGAANRTQARNAHPCRRCGAAPVTAD